MNSRQYGYLLLSLWVGMTAFVPSSPFSREVSSPSQSKIDIQDVQCGGEIGRRIDMTIEKNIQSIDIDKDFLLPFQEKNRSDGYIGLGKFIDSLVRLSAHTRSETLIALKDRVIGELLKTQEADGYMGISRPDRRMWALWDIHEMNYLANGLTSDFLYFHSQKSLDAAIRLMNYLMTRWQEKPDGLDRCGITVFMAVTGLEETLLMMHKATGDPRYLDFCVQFRQLPEWDSPIVRGRYLPIEGHAYAYLHRCLAQLRLYRIQPDPTLLLKTRGVLDFLTEGDGLTINGVCSQDECWHDTQDGTEGLGETCATAYLIRVLDELIRMESNSLGDSLYGDMMERSIFNGLFAAQSPDGRHLRYYVPFEGQREYFDGDTYCCPCNYRRIVAELPGMIYYPKKNGVIINLYTPSETQFPLSDPENGGTLKIRQETDYPNSGEVTISVYPSKPTRCSIALRIPRWCKQAQIEINGIPLTESCSGGTFYPIEREWQAGDKIVLHMPMPWRWIQGRKAQSGRVALMRGPQVFCLDVKKNPEAAGIDLRKIYIDPDTVEGPFPDNTVRPDGMACRVKGWKSMSFETDGNHTLNLTLTEFPDPDGVFTYFRVRKFATTGEPDDLIRQ